ncbi:diol dehydratase small subunit [Nakamurella endophytica]
MDPAVLRHQGEVAQRHGNPQLAENLFRAAELAVLEDARVLALYESLRPHRSTGEELDRLAAGLRADGATRCAALVESAATWYRRRGLLR